MYEIWLLPSGHPACDLRQLDGVGHDEQPLEDAPGFGVRAVQVLGVAEVDDAAAPCALGGNVIGLKKRNPP